MKTTSAQNTDNKKSKKTVSQTHSILKKIAIFIGAMSIRIAFALGIIASFILLTLNDLPSSAELSSTQLKSPLRVYSSEGHLIAEFGNERRKNIDITDAPKQLIQSIIASEDNNYYKHFGVDFKGIIRAALSNALTGSRQGASTITQQVARNYFLSSEQTYKRKLKEVMLAFKLEATLSKEEILNLYINKIFLGHRSYGFAAAANVYYGKEIDELTIAEHAMLAGLPKAPSRHNPISNPKRAETRRNYVLKRLLDNEWISDEQYQTSIKQPITAERQKNTFAVAAPYVAEISRQFVLEMFGEKAYSDGFNIYTNIKSEYQAAANSALRTGLLSYDKRHGYRGATASLKDSENTQWLKELANFQASGNITPVVINSVTKTVLSVQDKYENSYSIKLEDSLWARKQVSRENVGRKPSDFTKLFTSGDVIYIEPSNENPNAWRLSQLPEVQGTLVSTDSKSGNVVALAGGFDFYFNNFNRAIQARRQPGSSLKPFIYAAALQQGYQPSTKISGAPIVIEDKSQGTVWRPENYSKKIHPPTTIRRALAKSMNLVSIRLLRATGVDYNLEYINKFGIPKNRLSKSLSLALGTGNVTPIELNTAFAVLANTGHYRAPSFINRIESRSGEIVYKQPIQQFCERCEKADNTAPRVMDRSTNFIANDMLRDVVRYGTARKAQKLNRNDLAGKTGTTNDYVDAWFNGYGGGLVTTAWVGFDQPQTLGHGEAGGRAALPIWIDYMEVALKGRKETVFTKPDNVKQFISTETNRTEYSLTHPGSIINSENIQITEGIGAPTRAPETTVENQQIEELF